LLIPPCSLSSDAAGRFAIDVVSHPAQADALFLPGIPLALLASSLFGRLPVRPRGHKRACTPFSDPSAIVATVVKDMPAFALVASYLSARGYNAKEPSPP
jgi:hypothetical protein